MAKRSCSWSKKVYNAVLRYCVSNKARQKIDKAVRRHPDWNEKKAESWDISPFRLSVVFDTRTKKLSIVINEWWVTLYPSQSLCHIDSVLDQLRQDNELKYGTIQPPISVVILPFFKSDYYDGHIFLAEETESITLE